jgi:hypothetical protein
MYYNAPSSETLKIQPVSCIDRLNRHILYGAFFIGNKFGGILI